MDILALTNELLKTAKDLEAQRDLYVKKHSKGLVEQLLAMQINIFYTTYVLALSDPVEQKSVGIENSYLDYFRVKFAPIRYLLELYLMMAHVIAIDKELERFTFALSLSLSNQVDVHMLDLALDEESSTANTLKKLRENRENYKKFIAMFAEKWNPALPDNIDAFVLGKGSIQERFSTLGLSYCKFSKIDYSFEIKTNPLVKNVDITSPQAVLRHVYRLLSLSSHPTNSDLIEFEQFFSKSTDDKNAFIVQKKTVNQTILRPVGKAMVELAKTGLKYYQ